MSTGPSDGAMDLIGQIVGANVANLAAVTDRVEQGLRDEIRRLAEGILDLEQVLAEATVVDRRTEARLRGCEPIFCHASAALDHVDRLDQIAKS